jgi:plasmid stability protein
MTTFTIKNIPPSLYEKLKKSAERNRRSINNEIIVCIEKSVQSQALDTNQILAKARKLRSLTNAMPITDDELINAIEDGRP